MPDDQPCDLVSQQTINLATSCRSARSSRQLVPAEAGAQGVCLLRIPRHVQGKLVMQPVSPYPIHHGGPVDTLRIGVSYDPSSSRWANPTLEPRKIALRLATARMPVHRLTLALCRQKTHRGKRDPTYAGSVPWAGISGTKSMTHTIDVVKVRCQYIP